jgi:muconolactone D-isomerase
MEFLVRIEISVPPETEARALEDVLARERERGLELLEAGVLKAIWRIPGRHANVGIWEAADATALDEVLSTLPLKPWMDVDVTPLAQHPLVKEFR